MRQSERSRKRPYKEVDKLLKILISEKFERIQRVIVILGVIYLVWLSVQAYQFGQDIVQLQDQVRQQEAQLEQHEGRLDQQYELVQSAIRDTTTFNSWLLEWQYQKDEGMLY